MPGEDLAHRDARHVKSKPAAKPTKKAVKTTDEPAVRIGARVIRNRPANKISDLQKFMLTQDPNQRYIGLVSSLHEGRIARFVTDVG